MGLISYGLCHTCRKYVDLDKFYDFAVYQPDNPFDIDLHDKDDFIFRALRLQYFMSKHKDHKIGVHNENSVESFGWYEEGRSGWIEQFPWPRPKLR